MAEGKLQLDFEAFSCPICLDLLNDPVTIPCGHSYCMSCVQNHWNREDKYEVYSCPQCRKDFEPRPVLVKNTMLFNLVEQLKNTGHYMANIGQRDVANTDVVCDVCIGYKLKAIMSCLQCMASYCETHLQPHYQSAALGKHQLMAPSDNLQENICSQHSEVKKMFCRTDQQLICVVCCVGQHKGHDTVMAADERAQKQAEVELMRDQVLHIIQDKAKDLEKLDEETEDLLFWADEAVQQTAESFTGLIQLVQKGLYEVESQIRIQQKTEEARNQQFRDKLQQDITELRRTHAQLDALALTPNHNFFLHKYASLSREIEAPTYSPMTERQAMQLFDYVTTSISDLTNQLKHSLTESLANISPPIRNLPPQPDPTTREDFLKYSCQITMDVYTAHAQISLSEGDRRAKLMEEDQKYPDHPERFTYYWQVLSREGLMGRCYWEVEWEGSNVEIALTYKSIMRKGDSEKCVFGHNSQSWALYCDKTRYLFKFNKVQSNVSGPVSNRIGVYLDHNAGVVCFYSISETMTLLHTVQITFTQPLHVGLRFYWGLYFTGDTARFLTPM